MGLERPKALNGVYSEAIGILKQAENFCEDEVIKDWLGKALDILEPTWRMEP